MVAPAITSIAPSSGTNLGGTSVVITGTDFTGATSVSFDSVPAASFVVNSATQITAVSPALGSGGVAIKNIIVVTPGGTSSINFASQFIYVQPHPVPTYTVNNVFFDPLANYTFFGHVEFAYAPTFPDMGGVVAGGGAKPAGTLPAGYYVVAYNPNTRTYSYVTGY